MDRLMPPQSRGVHGKYFHWKPASKVQKLAAKSRTTQLRTNHTQIHHSRYDKQQETAAPAS